MTSDKKLSANRKNSVRSTGPRTPEGKVAIKFNALKHGLTAAQVLLPDEDEIEFRSHMEAIDQHLQPSGALEQVLSEAIAMKLWRLRRVLRMEAEILRHQTRNILQFGLDHDDPLGRAFLSDCQSPEAMVKLSRYETALQAQLMSCLREFREVRAHSGAGGFVSQSTMQQLNEQDVNIGRHQETPGDASNVSLRRLENGKNQSARTPTRNLDGGCKRHEHDA